jgi:hypothetical protein
LAERRRAYRVASFFTAALEGDFRDRLTDIVRACGRRPVGEVLPFADWGSVAPLVARPNHLGAAVSGRWTVLVDDGEMTADLFDNPEVGAALAARYATRVVCAFAHSVTGGCGYRVHTPAGTRSVVVDESGVVENEGEPLPGEDTADLDKHDMYSVLDVLGLVGLDVADGVEASVQCAALQLAPKRAKRSG